MEICCSLSTLPSNEQRFFVFGTFFHLFSFVLPAGIDM